MTTMAGEASTDTDSTDAACSFCLKAAADVGTLVAGPGVYICDQCVGLSAQVIAAKPEVTPEVSAAWNRDLSDEDLLALLPKVASAQAQAERQLTRWVRRARARGITWTRIGAALGMTRQSAWERFSGEE
jgi:ClpX C4-type zinc finger